MFVVDFSFFSDSLIIFLLAFLIDLIFGELPDSLHPTLWLGKIILFLKLRLKTPNDRSEKINGVLLCFLSIIIYVIPVFFIINLVRNFFGWLPFIFVSAFILSTTIAIRCMKQYTIPVANALENHDYDKAKELLPFIVRRNPNGLTRKNIISAAVETIAEGTTDGITSAFFYFALFGVLGAVTYRVVNTLDSMVGYKDPENINIGWFSAKMDTILNYIPARLTAFLMILASVFLGENWKESLRILRRDRKNTESPNAGWTLSAMSGALNIQLEKPGFYIIGDTNTLTSNHIIRALKIMLVTTILFAVTIVFPLLAIKSIII